MKSRWLRHGGWLGCVAAILISGPVFTAGVPVLRAQDAAQEFEIELQDVQAAPPAFGFFQEAAPRKFWIGLMCNPAEDALRSHLGLEEKQGLVVSEAVKDSPAAKAGLQQHDVVTKVGDKAVASIEDLVQAVEASEGKELAFELIRKGEKTSVKITPVKPPEDAARAGAPVPQDVFKFFQEGAPGRFRFQQAQPGQMRLHMVQPGVVAAPEIAIMMRAHKLPADLSITITRKGEEPAKISVSKGDQKWETTEDKLKELPDDVRPHVEQMLGRAMAAQFSAPKGRVEARFEHLEDVRKRFPQAAEAIRVFERAVPGPGGDKLEKEMAEIKAQLEELKKAVDSLKKDK